MIYVILDLLWIGKDNELKLNESQNMFKQFIALLLVMANYDRLVLAEADTTTADAEPTLVDIPDTWDTLVNDAKDTWKNCATNVSIIYTKSICLFGCLSLKAQKPNSWCLMEGFLCIIDENLLTFNWSDFLHTFRQNLKFEAEIRV